QPVDRARQYALIAQGDEVLDWREMQEFCTGGRLTVLPGSDHAISDFPNHLDELMDFLRLAG
nr:esterase [Hydrogenophaga sp.]